MNSPTLSLIALVLVLGTPVAGAQRAIAAAEHPSRPVVIELFSSQSCGNCPVANENVALLAQRSDVVAMTYPVGYWDYLGWDDTFAKPEFTARQKEYNRALKHRGPYTPQIVYSGRLHGSGTKLQPIGEKFETRDLTPYPVKVAIGADEVTVSGERDVAATVTLVRFRPGMTSVTPGAGANRGKPMKYYNLVTSIQKLGDWKGGVVSFKATCDHGCTVLVQDASATGHVVGVAEKR
ncbi:MAG: DUF1223 domain-containing protein [Alphaproteobacteria bacterium]|nr:DUF1223 domain-containing protein [Alphaproteobacteria bacterium]